MSDGCRAAGVRGVVGPTGDACAAHAAAISAAGRAPRPVPGPHTALLLHPRLPIPWQRCLRFPSSLTSQANNNTADKRKEGTVKSLTGSSPNATSDRKGRLWGWYNMTPLHRAFRAKKHNAARGCAGRRVPVICTKGSGAGLKAGRMCVQMGGGTLLRRLLVPAWVCRSCLAKRPSHPWLHTWRCMLWCSRALALLLSCGSGAQHHLCATCICM